MTSFFDALEGELRDAAGRPPKRGPDWPAALRGGGVVAAVVAVAALALIPLLVVLGNDDDRPAPAQDRGDRIERREGEMPRFVATPDAPVGSVIPKGTGKPPRDSDSTVVAKGEAHVSGPWQMEVYESIRLENPESGEDLQPPGLPCLGFYLLDPPPLAGGGSGHCGEFPRTPGFSRQQHVVPNMPGERIRENLVYGWVPEEAALVQLSVGDQRIGVKPFEGPPGVEGDFYLLSVPPNEDGGRVNWLDADGNPGSRGIELLPY
jgi:hypothetical protein